MIKKILFFALMVIIIFPLFPVVSKGFEMLSTLGVPSETTPTNRLQATEDAEKISISNPLVKDKKIPILMFHEIADEPTTSETNLFVRPSELKAHLQYLADNDFQTITFEDLDNVGAFSKPVMLTLDDGYVCDYTILFPLLKEFNMKATIFIIPNTFWSSNYLSESNILEMSNSGLVSIQSHTVSHPDLTTLDHTSLDNELSNSKQIIEELTGKPVIALGYPFGSNNETVRTAAANYYDYAVTTVNGKFKCGSNAMSMKRMFVKRGLGAKGFASLVD